MNFPCTKCGACCRRAYLLPYFQYTNLETGCCSKLENNLCSIYKDRPFICQINESKKIFFSRNLKKYYKLNALMCNSFIIEDKMNSYYLIDLAQFED